MERILQCASYAPSPKNSQPWRFIVVESEEKMTEVLNAMINGLRRACRRDADNGAVRSDVLRAYETVETMRGAAATIFVVMDTECSGTGDGG